MSRHIPMLIAMMLSLSTHAQHIFKGKIIDAATKEPIPGATIHCTDKGCNCGCITNAGGEFEMRCRNCHNCKVSFVGYSTLNIVVDQQDHVFALAPATSLMNEVVISANRGEAVKRSEAPIAIATLSNKAIQDAKPATIDQILNKVSGVNMINLGNEQHEMSIRQPMTTKSLFLYLEDGIPIRTTGLFNHNALLEMNMAATKSIEVIKGPSSSLYGSEAIGGVVNFISLTPSAIPVVKLTAQGNNIGYKRGDLQTGFSAGKWGFALNGYYAAKGNSYLEFTDYHKGIITGRLDYRFSDKTVLSSSLTCLNYFSDMPGGVDSFMFASKSFTNSQTFTYRKVNAVRYHTTLTQAWNEQSKTTLTALYRDNIIEQNPNYRIRDDYRKVNGNWVGDKALAHGEINASGFRSYSLIAQHRQNFNWKKAILIGGMSVDLSPSRYRAQYIRIRKDTASNKYAGYQSTDSIMTNYTTGINNYAGFASFECTPVEKLRAVVSLRYDYFRYTFRNNLTPSAFSGAPDTTNGFKRISPKVGFTYNFSARTGLYANYSEGFVPPQVSDLYTGVRVPYLNPSVFYNYEVGGWVQLILNKLSADLSLYDLQGKDEVVSVKLDDGSYENQNAGKTSHKGIEFGLNATPVKDITVRVSGAYSEHRFLSYIEKGVSYNGNEMNNAPHWLYNAELWYKPASIKGFRIGTEVQHVGSYFADPQNTAIYKGYTVLNLRLGYAAKGFDVWVNVLNATNRYYSNITTKSAFGWSYQLAEPLNVNAGIGYNFAELLKVRH
jgi:iron complex outermembrane receptor protein